MEKVIHFFKWIKSFGLIIDGICGLLTLGMYRSRWNHKALKKIIVIQCNQRIKLKQEASK